MRRRLPILLFMVVAILLATAGTVHGATVVLPYHNVAGFLTSVVVVNPTDHPVTLDGFWGASGVGAPVPVIQPHSVFRAAGYPDKQGGGVYTLSLPDGVFAYTELRYPTGMRVRYSPLTALEDGGASLTIYDVLTDGADYKSYLYFAAPQGGAFTVRSYDAGGKLLATDAYVAFSGDAQIVPVVAGAARLALSSGVAIGGAFGHGPIYAFSIVSHQPEGQVIITYPQ